MARIELIMPKLGESVMEATILSWEKKVGDKIALDENVLTIATDKVDTEVPSPVEGVLAEILFGEGSTVAIGTAIAIIETEASAATKASPALASPNPTPSTATATPTNNAVANNAAEAQSDRFYSPLVKSIAKTEGIALTELERIEGTGSNGRVTKTDVLGYLENRQTAPAQATQTVVTKTETPAPKVETKPTNEPRTVAAPTFNQPPIDKSNVEIIEMDRMRRLIADHMVMSKHVSPHVTSFVEVDVTNMVRWREKVKGEFEKKYSEKITFTPIFVEAMVKAIQDYPMVNVSVDGYNIIRHKSIHMGMAAALPTGNLIVPVIRNADTLNLVGLTKQVNDLAGRARNNKLRPDEIQGGTITLSNVGSFGSVMGTPIINQPQCAILVTGTIRKKPAVLETPEGDVIAIRHMMFLSLSYDHRVIDGMLGGMYLRRVADYLEAFDANRTV